MWKYGKLWVPFCVIYPDTNPDLSLLILISISLLLVWVWIGLKYALFFNFSITKDMRASIFGLVDKGFEIHLKEGWIGVQANLMQMMRN